MLVYVCVYSWYRRAPLNTEVEVRTVTPAIGSPWTNRRTQARSLVRRNGLEAGNGETVLHANCSFAGERKEASRTQPIYGGQPRVGTDAEEHLHELDERQAEGNGLPRRGHSVRLGRRPNAAQTGGKSRAWKETPKVSSLAACVCLSLSLSLSVSLSLCRRSCLASWTTKVIILRLHLLCLHTLLAGRAIVFLLAAGTPKIREWMCKEWKTWKSFSDSWKRKRKCCFLE